MPAFVTFSSGVCVCDREACAQCSVVLMLSRYPIGQTAEEFPVPSEQNSQTEFSDNALWVNDADRRHVNSKESFARLAI